MRAFFVRSIRRRGAPRPQGYRPTPYERDLGTVICALGNTDPPPRATVGRLHRTTKR